jgi:hypothetical protein
MPYSKRGELRHLLRQIDNDEQLRLRGAQHAILRASGWYWVMRAEMFDWARPRPGDFAGAATPEELVEADRRCSATRDTCLAKAALLDLEAEGVSAGDLD